jgi:hypothetical protein
MADDAADKTADYRDAPAWLDAAASVWMRRFFGGFPEGLDPEGVFLFLGTLARAQAGAEYAYEQLEQALADNSRADEEGNPTAGIDAKLRMFLYLHAFVVEANLFYDTLEALQSYLPAPELKRAWRVHRGMAKEVGDLRDHVEHLPERIKKGRRAGRGGRRVPMERSVFRQAVGAFEGMEISYGDERFDLRAIRDAITQVEETTAPRLVERLALKFNATVTRAGEVVAEGEGDEAG